jgi:hypothetical protein
MTDSEPGRVGRREGAVLAAVVDLVDSLLHDFDVLEMLTQLTERCVQLLDVASAGLLLADPSHQLHLMAATSEPTRDVEILQLQADEGPCLDCYSTGTAVSIADLAQHTIRWPRFVDAAAGAGFVSVHAVPMRAAGLVIGALGLFGTTAGALNDADLAVGQTLAHIATVAIIQDQAPQPSLVLPRLRSAVANQVVIEQAKGYLRARLDITIDEAFALLRRYAGVRQMHLTELARALVSDRQNRSAIVDGLTALLHEMPNQRA